MSRAKKQWKRIQILKNFGINLYSDPLLMVADDVIWY
jgi:hypothetical protein